MPSDQSTWLISAPLDGDTEGLVQELLGKLQAQLRSFTALNIAELTIPQFKTGTLDTLIALSEDLPKQDTYFTSVVAKIVDTLRSLLKNDTKRLEQHILVNERPVDAYLMEGWRWNEGRYHVNRALPDLVGQLNKDISSIDSVMKNKLNSYNLAKGSLVQMQRKKTGNLSTRSLADVVSKEHFIEGSEYLETLLVAVPKNLAKEWTSKYERLTAMVVPRSSQLITSDDDYSLFAVVIFKRVRDEFAQKLRENKFILRDFTYSEEKLRQEQEQLDNAETAEKELWTELLRLSRTNFSEAFQLLIHIKVVRLFVESVLRYGLPASYIGVVIKPDPKQTKRILTTLSSHFAYLAPRSNKSTIKQKKSSSDDKGEEFMGEYQTLMEQEYFDFVLFEVPWIVD